ncbi:hypothetical protein [Spirosoma daeguense]
MNSLTYICIGTGLLLYYYFVLRRFRSLGFRMFSLFTFVSLAAGYWIYEDSLIDKAIQQKGQLLKATIISKKQVKSSTSGSPDNEINVVAAVTHHQLDTLTTSRYVSAEEWSSWQVGEVIDIYYVDNQNLVVAKISFDRYLGDRMGLYVGVGIFFLIGVLCWFFLNRYNIGVDPETGYEWLEKDGKIYFDERQSKASQVMKRANIVLKMIQLFSR